MSITNALECQYVSITCMCSASLMARCTEALVCWESAWRSGRAARRMSICVSAE